MKVLTNIDLANYSTMRLGGKAKYLVEIETKEELRGAVAWAKSNELQVVVIGSGSNIVWSDLGFEGLVIVNSILGYEAYEQDDTNTFITVGAGEAWDSIVERSVSSGLSGIECLSLVPGKAGATPVQNVGAYGQEIAGSLTTVEVYDSLDDKFHIMPVEDCDFGYRTSRFKVKDKGRFFIITITLHLNKVNLMPPFYGALTSYLDANNIKDYSPASIRQAVISIRQSKLPDPNVVNNVGSFFANPIIEEDQLINIQDTYSMVPNWPAGEGKVKLSAAWLIEQVGFKGYKDSETGMATWKDQPLVLVNESAKSTQDLLDFKQKIVDAVISKFGIKLIQEPELLP
jgi:UDP-N-acetylmuramate dehydrogenase